MLIHAHQENIIKAAGSPFWEAITYGAKGGEFNFDEGAERLYKEAYLTDDAIHAVCPIPRRKS